MAMAVRRCPLVLFGSQSGNAADVADKVWRSALLCGADSLRDVRVRSLDGYMDEVEDEAPPFPDGEWSVIFICSTTGQGDPPDNMTRFWRRLMRRSMPERACQGLKVAVFGLGDSSYPKYNFVAKKLYRRLLQLGAEMLLPLGLADDQHPLGIDGALSSWLENLLKSLVAASGENVEVKLEKWRGDEIPFKFSVRAELSDAQVERAMIGDAAMDAGEMEKKEEEPEIFPSHAFPARVVSNERITSEDHFQDTRHVILATPPPFPPHRPGQVLMVQPSNCEDDVASFLSLVSPSLPRLPLLLSSAHPTCHPVTLPSGALKPHFLPWFARHFFDLNSVPRKSFFELLAAFSCDEDEKERLEELSDAANLDDLFSYCYRPRRTCLETLQDFPKTTRGLTLSQLFELLPEIRPRAFSIASSSVEHRGEVHLLIAVVDYKSVVLKKRRRGLCSTYLARGVSSGDLVPVWLAPSVGMKIPVDAGVPMIMVGPGTGLAPFRSALQERRRKGTVECDLLFFGCRSRHKDFYFADEWRTMEEEGRLRLVTAFSRDDENSRGGRMYVQDRMKENGALIWQLLSRGAYFFIAGNAKRMPDAVRSALVEAVSEHGAMTVQDAEVFVTKLERVGRYQAETWS